MRQRIFEFAAEVIHNLSYGFSNPELTFFSTHVMTGFNAAEAAIHAMDLPPMKEEYDTLIELLSDGMPDLCVADTIHLPKLARALGVTRQNVHKWMSQNNQLSADMARKIMVITNKRVTADHLIKFIGTR